MADVEIFNKRISSLIKLAKNNDKFTLLPFLDEASEEILLSELKKEKVVYSAFGGIIDAERKRYYIGDMCDDFKIRIYKIIYNKKYYTINHRNVLGSLMGIGIKRECIGDIVIDDNKDVFFAVTDEISEFIENDFNYVGNIKISIVEYFDEVKNEIKYAVKDYFLSSMRIDLVVSDGFGIPRNEAKDMVLDGLVKVNQIDVLKPDHKVDLNDEISVRHKGRLKIMEIGGLSKSGKQHLKIGRRI